MPKVSRWARKLAFFLNAQPKLGRIWDSSFNRPFRQLWINRNRKQEVAALSNPTGRDSWNIHAESIGPIIDKYILIPMLSTFPWQSLIHFELHLLRKFVLIILQPGGNWISRKRTKQQQKNQDKKLMFLNVYSSFSKLQFKKQERKLLLRITSFP